MVKVYLEVFEVIVNSSDSPPVPGGGEWLWIPFLFPQCNVTPSVLAAGILACCRLKLEVFQRVCAAE